MGNKGGLTFVVEKEGFATTCTAIRAPAPRRRPFSNAPPLASGLRGSRNAAAGEDQRDTEKLRADGAEVDVQSPP